MTDTSQQKPRWIAAAASLALAAGIIAGFVPWTVNSKAWRDGALTRLSAALGAQTLSAGTVRFSILPLPRLEVADLVVRQNSGSSLAAPTTFVQLRLGPLARGVLKPATISFAGPDIHLVVPASETRGLRQIAMAASKGGLLAMPADIHGIDKISVDGGRMTIRNGVSGERDTYDNLRMRLAFAGPTKPLSFAFSARRGGEETHVSFKGASRDMLVSGRAEPVTFSYWTPGFSVEFDGKGSFSGTTTLDGQLLARSGARGPAPFVSSLAGLGMASVPPLEMNATLAFNDRGANLSDLRLTIDRDRFTGVGAVRHDGQRWHVAGTLAGELANLAPFATSLAQLRKTDGVWNTTNMDSETLFGANIDLRVSADRMVLGDIQLSKAALALMTRAGRAELTLGDATYQSGSARFRLMASPGTDGLDVKFNGSLDRVDLGAVIAGYTRSQRFTGKGNAALVLETSGRSVAQFVANADGRLSAALRDGDLVGIDLNRLALRRYARPDVMLTESLGGRTPFESATLSTKITRGLAAPIEGRMQGGRIVGTVTGAVDFAQALTDLNGSVVQIPAETFVVEPIPILDFSVSGPLSEPRITPNIAALFKRS